ncbi:hypothetical protein QE382_004757 [Sphingobacterium zeae]|uniref:Uncharacterized protein n=1 Tax=Sphingobacterium zeae TaxID=1776859 RepID=A0ABU0UD35_9SPHI|nr:hypothetical protein [Sphingobacterium zeae]
MRSSVSHISKNDVALFFTVQLLLLEKHGILKSSQYWRTAPRKTKC